MLGSYDDPTESESYGVIVPNKLGGIVHVKIHGNAEAESLQKFVLAVIQDG